MLEPTEPQVSFRLVTSEDVERLVHFFETLSDATRKRFGFSFNQEHAETWVKEGTSDPGMRRFLVFEHSPDSAADPVMLGTVWLWNWTKQVVWFGIIIADAFQSKGYGSKLIEIAIAEAKKSNKGGILLSTHKTNHRAQRLYQKHDFEIIGEDARGEYLMLLNFPVQG